MADAWLDGPGGGHALLAPLRDVAASLAAQLKGRGRLGAAEAGTGRRLLRLCDRLADHDTARAVRRAFALHEEA